MLFRYEDRITKRRIDFKKTESEKITADTAEKGCTQVQPFDGQHQLLFDTGHILTGAGIYLNFISFLDKRRHLQLITGFNDHRFGI